MPNNISRRFNPKRALLDPAPPQDELIALAERVSYGGNPEHKSHPGDFGLTPPSAPRPDKTLCAATGIVSKSAALAALRSGVRKGLISRQKRGEWPQNIWSVSSDGIPLGAQLENEVTGTDHGYPLPESDQFCDIVRRAWESR
jgi:hypothetical protein